MARSGSNTGACGRAESSRGCRSCGPLSNLGVGVALTLVVALVPMSAGLVIGLSFLALLQIVTFILNILPIPGLDGWGAIEPYLSPGAREFGAKARPWAPIVLFAVLFLVPGASSLLWQGSFAVFDTIGGFKLAAMYGQDAFMFWK